MLNDIKISVIIPIYNVECYLKECLESVINQTLNDIEIICINDGSTDNSLDIVKEYLNKDKRIKLIDKTNSGYGAACNSGLYAALGKYIAIVEPDDFIDINMYKDLYELAEKNNADIVKSSFYENYDIDEIHRVKKVKWNRHLNLNKNVFTIKECPLFMYFHPSVWSCIYKNEFIKENNISFVEAKGSGWTDNPFQVQTMCLANRICYTDNAYYYWRKRNLDDADDLKDYTIPFERSREIHSWLKEQNIFDNDISSCLIKREMTYINLVLKMINIKNISKCFVYINEMIERWDSYIIKNSKFFERREKQQYFMLLHFPFFYLLIMKFKKIKKSLISFRWNKREKIIRFNKFYLIKEVVNG